MDEYAAPTASAGGNISSSLSAITVDKSVEFSYEELATATDNFSLANKIGQGGFGAVYYAELRGEVCTHSYTLSYSSKRLEKHKQLN